MKAENILAANLLDIQFEGRNKAYGAYDLRKNYNRRISTALFISLGIISIAIFAITATRKYASTVPKVFEVPETEVSPVPDNPPPIPPPAVTPPPVATIAYPPPLIVDDEDVLKPPPDIQDLLNARIDVRTIEGTVDEGEVPLAPATIASPVVPTPATVEAESPKFEPKEIDASFPGGAAAWARYIQKEIEKNIEEFTEADYGTCKVKFAVDKNGKVSNVQAMTMRGSKLAEITVNAIRKGPDWIPAKQNGTYVTADRIQPVTLNDPSR